MLQTINKDKEKEIHKMTRNVDTCDEIGSKITNSLKSKQKLEIIMIKQHNIILPQIISNTIACNERVVVNAIECMACQFATPYNSVESYIYHCSTQEQLGSMHSAPADVGDE